MNKLFVALAAAALAVSAAAEDYDLEKVRIDNEQLIREWCQAGWDNAVYGKPVDIAGLLEKYSYLSDDPGLLAFLREKGTTATSAVEARRFQYLYRDLATTHEAKRVAAIEDEMENRSSSDHIWV
jgi:hypothetical protein